jgi:uncharacterized protein YgbK (DUF1537 family)
MADLGAEQTIYCPAFPENGRSVYMGNLFVGRQLLAESPMKDHPLTPMRDSNLVRLIEPQVTQRAGLVDRLVVARGPGAVREALDALRADGVAHVVVDAIADEDLGVIAQACRNDLIMTGGSALAMPLPHLYAEDGLMAAGAGDFKAPALARDAIVLSGSCSAMTRAQVEAYRATGAPSFRLDPLTLASKGPGEALDWLSAQSLESAPLLYATAEPDQVRAAQAELGVARAGEVVEAALAKIAIAARDQGARRFVVAGGETSGAVTKALRIDRLVIGAEVAPGVPWCFATSGGTDVAITLKSGNFGKESFFSDALSRLEEKR